MTDLRASYEWKRVFETRQSCRILTISGCIPVLGIISLVFIWIKRCNKTDENPGQFKTRYSEDNVKPSENNEHENKYAYSVGVLICKKKPFGTVFVVGGKYIITAWHVLKSALSDLTEKQLKGKEYKDWSPLAKTSIYVEFFKAASHVYLSEEYVFMDKKFDIAIISLIANDDINPSLAERSLKMAKTFEDVTEVMLIGYGFPNKPDTQFFETDREIISNTSERIKEAVKESNNLIDKYKHLKDKIDVSFDYSYVKHDFVFITDAYMEHGASGSPAIANGNVVGIFTRGVPNFYYHEMFKNYQAEMKNEHCFELCVKTSSLFKDFKKDNEPLFNEIWK